MLAANKFSTDYNCFEHFHQIEFVFVVIVFFCYIIKYIFQWNFSYIMENNIIVQLLLSIQFFEINLVFLLVLSLLFLHSDSCVI